MWPSRIPNRLLLALVASCCWLPSAHADPTASAAPVEVADAVNATFAPVLWSPGGVFSTQDARIGNAVAGRIEQIAEVGDRVRAGAVLARVDDALLGLRERENRAAVERIRAQLEYSSSQEARLAALVERGSISGAQLQEARSQRRVLEQDLAAALAALDEVRHRIAQASVRAPFAGIVAERFAQPGEYIGEGQPLLRLVDTERLEVRAQVPVALAAVLRPGVPVTVRADQLLAEAALGTVVPVGDAASRQFEVRVPLHGSGLPVGTPVQLALPSDVPRQVVAVPRDALVIRREATYVVRLSGAGTAERLAVSPGPAQDGLVEVSGPVRAGDRLVVRGGERVQEGQAVTIASAAPAAAGGAGG